ncbi:MAG: very short patch repair endonuclease [Thermoplasmata archaeon]|jgi:DNA mismatch endonuclease, patch repair protein|nr:very short patch repair endonuclease [Thermoplasmata archaeon]
MRGSLWAMGYRGYRTNVRALPGRPDLAFLGARLAIFCNGCFWHRHDCSRTGATLPKSNTAYWAMKFELNRERDRRKEAELNAAGWNVLTLWECEILRDPRACALRVGKALRERKRLLTDPKGEVPGGSIP